MYRQHLAKRLPAGNLLEAAGACGVQNTPPGSAELALHARVASLTPGMVARALEGEKILLQAWSMRGAPHVFPASDAAIFTQGLLPESEAEIRAFLGGVDPALDKIGITAVRTLVLCRQVCREVLDGKALTKDQLGYQVAEQLLPYLNSAQASAWKETSWYAKGQSQGESVVRFFLPLLALEGICCHAERVGDQAYLRVTEQWRDSFSQEGQQTSKAELVRRYLRCYGPSTPGHFADWAGIDREQAQSSWGIVEGEMEAVDLGRKRAWMLSADIPELENPEQAAGVRFLPPHDPYLALRDRETILADKGQQRQVWRTTGSPGVLLVAGEVAGVWRPEKRKDRLKVRITLFQDVPKSRSAEIEAEAKGVAVLRGCKEVEVEGFSV